MHPIIRRPERSQDELGDGDEAISAPAEHHAKMQPQVTRVAKDSECARVVVASWRERKVWLNVAATATRFAEAEFQLEEVHRTQRRLIAERWQTHENDLSSNRQYMIKKLEARSKKASRSVTEEAERVIHHLEAVHRSNLLGEELAAVGDRILEVRKLRIENPTIHWDLEYETTECRNAIRLQQESQIEAKKQEIEEITKETYERLNRVKETYVAHLRMVDADFEEYRRGLETMKFAESQWVEAVFAERQSMLQTMRFKEIARARADL